MKPDLLTRIIHPMRAANEIMEIWKNRLALEYNAKCPAIERDGSKCDNSRLENSGGNRYCIKHMRRISRYGSVDLPQPKYILDGREDEIIALRKTGLSHAQIAKQLGVSLQVYVMFVKRKMGNA